jgi:hypothetical protein
MEDTRIGAKIVRGHRCNFFDLPRISKSEKAMGGRHRKGWIEEK